MKEETVHMIWKEWMNKSEDTKKTGDFEGLWCYISGMIGSRVLSKEQAKDIRSYLYRRKT